MKGLPEIRLVLVPDKYYGGHVQNIKHRVIRKK